MTPLQAVLRRVIKHKPGNKHPNSSVYCVARFQLDHPIGDTHFDDIISAIGAHWARVRTTKKKKFVFVELVFRMSPEEFEQQLATAQALEHTGLSRTVLRVALQLARTRSGRNRKFQGKPRERRQRSTAH